MRERLLAWLVAGVASCSLSAASFAQTTIYVDQSNPSCPGSGTEADPFCLIQDGIDAASDGDTVLVLLGVYTESIDFSGKDIVVRSRDGRSATVIHWTGSEPAVTFQSGEPESAALEGFTVSTNEVFGSEASVRVGWWNKPASHGTIRECHITGPRVGIEVIDECGVTIVGSSIGSSRSAGVFLNMRGRATIADTRLSSFHGLWESGYAHLERCEVRGTVMTDKHTSVSLSRCLVGSIQAHISGISMESSVALGTVRVHGDPSYLLVDHCTLNDVDFHGEYMAINNSIIRGSLSVIPPWPDWELPVRYSNIPGGWEGEGNIDADPRFIDAAGGDFRLACDSPCIDAGSSQYSTSPTDREGDARIIDGDSDGTPRPDMGADEFAFFVEPLVTGSSVSFCANAPPAEHADQAVVFVSYSEGSTLLPGSQGRHLPLEADPLLSWWCGLPGAFREPGSIGCPGIASRPLPIPPNVPVGLDIHYAGFTLKADGSVGSISPARIFHLLP